MARTAPLLRSALSFGAEAAGDLNRVRREREWNAAVRRVGQHRGPLVVGPWVSEVGFEVLYWVPFLRFIARRARIAPQRLTVVTRGGAACWYRDFAENAVEIFDLMPPDELRRRNEERVETTGGQKHMGLTDVDAQVLRRAAGRISPDAELIHPSLMYNAFRSYWNWRKPPKAVLRLQEPAPLPDPARQDIVERLPDEYVAVKAYHSSAFPPTPDNERFVARLVQRLAERANVVLLSTGLNVDDHSEVAVRGEGRVIDAQPWMTPQDNLEVQTQVIRGASALVSSYGGFSYLGPLLGVPSVCFWSEANFNATHLTFMHEVVKWLGAPRFVPLDVRDFDVLDSVLAAPAAVPT